MANIREARRALVARILAGEGHTGPAQRRAAFGSAAELPEVLQTLVGKVAREPRSVRDADFAAARAAGFSEDQLFELVVCAAIGQASRQYEAALAALDRATGKE